MDPQYEQSLRDEVIYLHSLWHQGPPTPATATSSSRHHLNPSKSSSFKKQKKKPKPKKANKSKIKTNNPDIEQPNNPSPGIEWPCPTPTWPPPTDTWPTPEPKTEPKPQTLSPDQQLKLASTNAHRQALKAVHDYFTSNGSDDDDEDDDELMGEDDGRVDYSFFFNLFKEDAPLREYYEANFARGEFSCLVCGAVGGKGMGKRFKGCLPLVQHSITIARTRKRRAHRAFGQAVCKVLGWDIDHLSAIVSLLSDKPGGGEAQENVNCGDKGSSIFYQENVNGGDKDSVIFYQENVNSGNKDRSALVQENIDSGDKDSSIFHQENVTSGDKDSSILVQEDSNSDNKGSSVLLQENVNSEDKDSSVAVVNNVDSVEDDSGDIVVPETGTTLGSGIVSPNGVERDTNSLACVDTDKNLEDHSMMHPHVVGEPVPQGMTSNSNTCRDADENLEDLGMMHTHSPKEAALDGLTTNSFVCTDTDNNLEDPSNLHPYNTFNSFVCADTGNYPEDPSIVHPCYMEEPAAEVPLNENNSAETEMQEWQTSNAVPDRRKEGYETEN